jgi:hypothetical protein
MPATTAVPIPKASAAKGRLGWEGDMDLLRFCWGTFRRLRREDPSAAYEKMTVR